MNSSSINEKESLEIIRNMIQASRQNISENAIHYQMWGWLVVVSSLGHYLVWKFSSFQHPYLFWTILMPLGAVAAIFISRKQAKQVKATTLIDRAMAYVWAGFAGPAIIAIVLSAVMGWEIVFPFFIALYGWGTLVSGGILKFRPLIIGGLICFALGILVIFAGPMEKLLVIAAAIISSHLIPGYLLKRTKKIERT